MQGRDERHDAIAQHHLGQVSADRVWNGIVHMKDVQVESSHHFCHFRRQHKIVWRILEQRIAQYLDFMEINAVFHCQPNWKCIADEVDVVTTVCQFFAQLGGNDSASSVCRIARNSDFHISTTWWSRESNCSI